MLHHQPIRKLELDIERIRRDFWSGTPSYARLFALFHEQYAQRIGKPRWGDQLAFIERFADPVFSAFPEARMIHMVRHPRQRFETSDPLRRRRMGRVGWDTARWMFSVRLGLRNQQRYPEQYQIVKYEALITRPEETLRKICEFIGEDFLPRLLTLEGAMRFGEEGASEPGPENGKPVRSRSMSKHEVIFLQAWAKKEIQALGYPKEYTQRSSKDILRFYAVDGPANAFGAMLWNLLKTDL
jgi:hypothetical protein